MKKIVFLDLEDTVLDDFSKGWSAQAMNHDKVARFLTQERPDEVRIFSFAISHEKDVATFEQVFKGWLEEALGVPIAGSDKVFTTRQLFDICRQAGTFYESELECMNLHGKDMGFFQFIRLCDEFVDCEVVLLDDAIGEPWNIQLPRRNVSIRILNVDTLQ